MTLSFEQIQRLATGCFAVRQEHGVARFDRMPPSPAALYQREPASRVRLECPSGVRLRFRTRTRRLRLSMHYGDACRPLYKGVLLVDQGEGVPFGPDTATPIWSGEIAVADGGGQRVLDMWLPHLVRADLLALEIDDGCEVEPVPPAGPRWLACGDSITQGMTAPLPTETWTARLAAHLDARALNWGVGGATMDATLAESLGACPYDLLTIAYGTNDFMRGISPDVYAANARDLLAGHVRHHPDAHCFLITPIPWMGREDPNSIGCSLEDYCTALRVVGRRFPWCHLFEGPALIPADPSLYVDGVHPNAAGMAIYAENLQRRIDAVLQGI